MKLKKISLYSLVGIAISLNANSANALDFKYDTFLSGFGVYREQDVDSSHFSEGMQAKGSFSLSQDISDTSKIGVALTLDYNLNHDFIDRNHDYLKELYGFVELKKVRFEVGKLQDISEKMMISAPDVGLLHINKSTAYKFIYPTDGFTMIDSVGSDFGEEKLGANIIYKARKDLKIGVNFSNGKRSFNKEDKFYSLEDDFKNSFSLSIKKDNYISNALQTAFFGSVLHADDTNIDGYSKASSRTEFSAGTNLNYHNFILGAGVRRIKERSPQNISYEGLAYNYGFAYSFGPWETSFSVHNSDAEGTVANPVNDDSKLKMFSLNYKLNKTTSLSTSIGDVKYEEESGISNEGNFVSFGFKMKFRDSIDVVDSFTNSDVWEDSEEY